MIRELTHHDIEQVYSILRKEFNDIDTKYLSNTFDTSYKFIVWDDEGINGFANITLIDKSERNWNLQIYVDPQFRNRGIGTALYQHIEQILFNQKASIITTNFRVDIYNPSYFFNKLGYNKWYGSPELHYRGTIQPDVDIDIVPYEDKYYQQYAICRQESFYELSVKNDFRPYKIPLSDEDRKYLFDKKDTIFITLSEEHLVGAITIDNGYLDHIMVSPAYQGKGYGKKLTQFGINKAISSGAHLVYICYIEGNEKAERLYPSLGFEVVCNTHVYRKFMNN
ncbi:GNAT family N-acetyltransferase [Vallitalea maricola]|uniref:Uncharacterized protein n=1 Tax=Vallitalea maricola TaxID=3074433 RepID=A0ACB5UPE5_9FIRM|nr:hypothetical protein AN2V17_38890 [Vallitalea sp. AN17-2]